MFCSVDSALILSGIIPLNLFLNRLRICKDVMSPIDEGIELDNPFMFKCIILSDCKPPIDDGIDPPSELSNNSNTFNEIRFPMLCGMLPVRAL